MSITRVLNEFRPLLRIFDEPLTRSPALWNNNFPARSFLDDPFIRSMLSRPAVDVTEQDDKYVIEADLPGMKKDNVKVRIGDEGRSITIEGKTGFSSTPAGENAADKPTVTDKSDSQSNTTADAPNNKLTTERAYASNAFFTRTVWLPRPVSTQDVAARLQDGVLKLTVNKIEDKGSVNVPVQ